MKAFPFPDRIGSREELKRDILYHKIPAEDRLEICDRAWDTGAMAAQSLFSEYGGDISIEKIAEASGLKIERKSRDNVAGKIRYFSEYYSGQNKIFLYRDSISKWAKANNLSYREAEELILSHEYFHFLECTKLGLTSKQYKVPTIKIGSLTLAKSGIRTLSEIGAHGFARTYYELHSRITPTDRPQKEHILQNHAVNAVTFDGQQTVDRMFSRGIFKIFTPQGRGDKE